MATRSILRCLWAFSIAASLGSLACQRQAAAPRDASVPLAELTHAAPTLLLSEVGPATELKHVFELKNNDWPSHASVSLRKLSCGCSSAWSGEGGRPVRQGDVLDRSPSGACAVGFGFRVQASPVLQSHYAEFAIRPAAGPEERLTARLSVRVLADVVVRPPVLSHSFTASDARPVSKALTILRTVRSEPKPKVRPVLGQLPPEVALVDMEDKGLTHAGDSLWTQEWVVNLRIAPGARDGGRRASGFDVAFEAPDAVSVRVPVTLRQRSGIEVRPAECDFGTVRREESLTRKVMLVAADEQPFVVTEAVSSLPGVTVAPTGSAPKACVIVELKACPSQEKEWKGNVRIRTTHPESPEISLAVSGYSP